MSESNQYCLRRAEVTDCKTLARMIDGSSDGAVNYLYQNVKPNLAPLDVLAGQLVSEVYYCYANSLVVEYQDEVVAMVLSFPSDGLNIDMHLLQHLDAAKQQYLRYFADNRLANSWHMDALYVEESHRNNGLGRQLLNEVKRQAQKYNFPMLQMFVYATNTNAIRFYQANGFLMDKKINLSAHEYLKDKQQLIRMRYDF